MSKLKIGLIGAGSISDLHLKAYRDNPEVELYAVSDLNEARAKAKAEAYGIANTRAFTNYQDLLALSELDAVSICTLNNTHAEVSIAALEAGKHVLIEKPLCQTVEEALRIEEAVRTSGRVLQVGFVRRHGSNTQILKKFIDAGDLGDIYYAKASCLRRFGNPGGWFADKKRSGGGPVIDLGVHIIDICWYLMGRPKVKSVSANTYHRLGNRSNVQHLSFYKTADYDASLNTVEDLANALIRFENGASLMLDVSFTLHAKSDELSVKLYGEKGGAELEPELLLVSEKYDTILNMSPQIDSRSFDAGVAFSREINHFVDSILGRTEPLSPVEDGVEIMKILCAIYESGEQGREIIFS
ncbi:Gfo/Idh/MocA family protein [Paenibacillus puldeungensis]|uniref:Gfo/Idh/MocA family protein n=1 Tax=Paenibacillus puldeungensis TaxID=696536 RepID=A0ABW3S1I6_9BACL